MTPPPQPDALALADNLESALVKRDGGTLFRQLCEEFSDEIIAALRSAAPPRGVPREPTQAMLDAFYTVGNGAGISDAWVRKVWRAMFDAAPSDRDREDAERWRYIRIKRIASEERRKQYGWLSINQAFNGWGQVLYNEDADNAVDAAIAASGGAKGDGNG